MNFRVFLHFSHRHSIVRSLVCSAVLSLVGSWSVEPLVLSIAGLRGTRVHAADSLDGLEVRSRDERFLTGLRERRLFTIAEAYCRERLQQAASGSEEQATLATEQVRILASHAANAPREQRSALYRAALEAGESFLQNEPNHPRRVLVQFQLALSLLAEGEQARREAELNDAAGESLAAARERIRASARACEQLDPVLAALQSPAPLTTKRDDPRLTQRELLGLRDQLQLLQSRCFQSQALCYPQGSPDRIAALERALQPLAELERRIAATDPLLAELRLEQAGLQRLLGDFQLADQTLNRLDPALLTVEQQGRLLAERLRLLIAGRQFRAAIQLAATESTQSRNSAEWDFAQLELYVAGWQAANQRVSSAASDTTPRNPNAATPQTSATTPEQPSPQPSADPANRPDNTSPQPPTSPAGSADMERGPSAADWERQAIAMARYVEQQHGPYWGRRADLLLVGVGRSGGSGNREILERTARDLYVKGQWQDAIVAFEQASKSAEQAGDSAAAFTLSYQAALIEQQRGDSSTAAARFRQVGHSWPQLPLAKNAHLQAILLTADRARSEPSALADYEQLLEEHLASWDGGETGDQVRLWQGRLCASRQQWEAAIETLIRVSPDSPLFPSLIPLLSSCWLKRIEELRRSGADLKPELDEALAFFDQQARLADLTNRTASAPRATRAGSASGEPAPGSSPPATSPATAVVASDPALTAPRLLAAIECNLTATRLRLLYRPERSVELAPQLLLLIGQLEAIVSNQPTTTAGNAAGAATGSVASTAAGESGGTAVSPAAGKPASLQPGKPAGTAAATPAAASGTTSTAAADQDRKTDVDSVWVARLIGESRALFVLAVAGAANERAAAEQQIPLLARASRNLLFSLLNDLDQRGTLLSAAEQAELAKLQLRVTDQLLSAEPTATEPTAAGNTAISASMREAIDRMRARALWRSGDSIAARTAYQELAARFPQDGQVQVSYAQLLESNPQDRPQLEQAILQWRRVLARSQPRTETWYQAKYGIAHCQLLLGDRAAAAQRIRYLQATENLSGTPWETAFQQLLKRCETASGQP